MTREIYRRVKRATVALAILDEESKERPFRILGSGFCIDPAGVVVTCAHVLEAFMSKSIQQQIMEMAEEEHNAGQEIHTTGKESRFEVVRPHVIFYDTERSREELVALPVMVDHAMAKTDHDLAMVRIVKHGYFPDGYPTVEIEDFEGIHEGDDVGLCGFPLGDFIQDQLGTVTSSFSRGIVSSIIPAPGVSVDYVKGFQLNIAATHGNSGGPVYSMETGRVFGVLARGLEHPQGGMVPGIVKAEPIYPLLFNNSVERVKKATYEEVRRGHVR